MKFTKEEKQAMAIELKQILEDYEARAKTTNPFSKALEGITLDLNGDDPIIEKTANLVAEPAVSFLEEAAETMKARAALRDKPSGERTAKKIAEVFNAITGHDLTESDAWMFLIVLKIVRSRSGKYNRDDYVDLGAYSSLLGEHESIARK